MIEKEIIVKNLKINYKVFGSDLPAQAGNSLLILHGWGSNSDRWQKVAELVSGGNFLIIIPDLPGFGKSQEPKNAWSLDNYVEWTKEFSDMVPELSNGFYLLGHSFGGAVASKFAIKYNQKIEKLFLISAACIRKKTIKKQVLGRISKLVKIFSFFPYYNFIKKVFYKFILPKSDYPYFQGVMKETYLKGISEDLSQYLSFVKIPTIIIWGDKDELTPISHAKTINKKIVNSKLIIISGGKHALQISLPEVLSKKILGEI